MNKRYPRTALFLGGLSLAILSSPAQAVSITATTDANTLISNILGPGITVLGTPSYTGTATQSGTFTGGTASGVGFDSGIIMTSGDVSQVPGPNDNGVETVGGGGTGDDDVNTSLGTAGDADLNALSGFSTFDAAVLEFEFEFTGGGGGDLFFNFAFASEEYVDFIGSNFNDVFGLFIDGVNIGLVPGTTDPITINTINNTENSAFYVNNVDNTDGIPNAGLDLSFDGLTTVITADAMGLGGGTHTMKFAVADASDGRLDAAVFIQAGTFSNEPPGDDDDGDADDAAVPEPASLLLFGFGLAGLSVLGRRRRKVA